MGRGVRRRKKRRNSCSRPRGKAACWVVCTAEEASQAATPPQLQPPARPGNLVLSCSGGGVTECYVIECELEGARQGRCMVTVREEKTRRDGHFLAAR